MIKTNGFYSNGSPIVTYTRDVRRVDHPIHVNTVTTPQSCHTFAEVAQLVELLPSKQVVEGSSPFFRSNGPDADGRSTDLQSDRMGSIPTVSTIWSHRLSVRTPGFHPGKSGSTPGGATNLLR